MYLFFVLLINSFAFSHEVKVIKKNGEIHLQSSDCATLRNQAKALNQWDKHQVTAIQISPCHCEKGVCDLNVNSVVPHWIREKQGTCSAFDGPNCWNSSLVSSGILPHLRYTSPEEMSFWLSSPLCQERKENEPVQPGDIIAIRTGKTEEVHGFINLTPELAFSKNGYAQGTLYQLQSPNNVFAVYDVPPNCRRVYKAPTENLKCQNYANYFKCDSIDSYLMKHPWKNQDQKSTWDALSNMDCEISALALTNTGPGMAMDLMKSSILAIQKLTNDKIAKSNLSDEDRFYWQGIRIKTGALLEQMDMLPSKPSPQ